MAQESGSETEVRDGKRLTLRHVAAQAGVSLSTASRVARGAPSVRPAVRRRVLEAIEALGYEPDTAARSIRTGQSHVIGYLVADIANPFFAAVVKGAAPSFEAEGYALVLASAGNDAGAEERVLRSLRARRVDGLVLSVADEEAPHLASLGRREPSVLLDREVAGLWADAVRSDHATGIGQAVGHLVALGHREIGFVGGSTRQYATRARADAFRVACSASGLTGAQERVVTEVIGPEASRRAVAELLSGDHRPTTLIVASYDLLVAALGELRSRGLHVPDDLSLVVCDDLDLCRLAVPPLDVIGRDLEELGREAARLLLERLEGRAAGHPIVVRLPTAFVRRGSTAPPRREVSSASSS